MVTTTPTTTIWLDQLNHPIDETVTEIDEEFRRVSRRIDGDFKAFRFVLLTVAFKQPVPNEMKQQQESWRRAQQHYIPQLSKARSQSFSLSTQEAPAASSAPYH